LHRIFRPKFHQNPLGFDMSTQSPETLGEIRSGSPREAIAVGPPDSNLLPTPSELGLRFAVLTVPIGARFGDVVVSLPKRAIEEEHGREARL
jgi:hypothetical protein